MSVIVQPNHFNPYLTHTHTLYSINQCICPDTMIMTDESTRECKCPPGTYTEENLSTGLMECTACPADSFQSDNKKKNSCTECSSNEGVNDKNTHTGERNHPNPLSTTPTTTTH